VKIRRIFAILLSSALLLAMATFPAEAAVKPAFGDYTIEYSDVDTFTGNADIASGYYTEGSVTIANNVAKIAGDGSKYGLLGKTGLSGVTAVEVVLKVTSGITKVSFTNSSFSSYAAGVSITKGTTRTSYSVYGDLTQSSVASGNIGSYFAGAQTVTIQLIVDATNGQAFVSVNGTVQLLDLDSPTSMSQTAIDNLLHYFSTIKIMTNSKSSSDTAEIQSIKVGTATPPAAPEPPANEKTGGYNVGLTVHNTYRTVYSVDFSFGNFAFTYIPEDGETPAKWEGNDGTNNVIAVTNRSNAPVRIDVTPTMNANLNGVTFRWDGALSAVLASAYGRDTPESFAVTATIGGTPGNSYVADGVTANVIGNVKVVVLGL